MPTRRRTPPTPTTFTLATVGDATTDEHRLTGALLEKHWLRLDAETLREIQRLVREGVGQGGG